MGLNLAYELEIYQRWGVKWVTFYGIPTRTQTDLVHQYGLKAVVYINALAIEYTELRGLGYDDNTIRDWAQKNRDGGYYYINTPTSKNATDDGYNSVRISPFAGYQGSGIQNDAFFELVLAPRLGKIVDPAQINADGVFTDVLFLKKKGTDTWGADANPHFMTRYNEWLVATGKTDTSSNFQEFRYFSIHYYAGRINSTVKTANPSAIVVISNNNVFTRSGRDSIALDISRLQDVSDVLLHEWADVDQVDPTTVINWVNWEKNGDPNNNAGLYHVTKPLWTHYLTYQAARFQTVVDAMNAYDFGYWCYNRYLWDNINSLNINVYDSQSGLPISGAAVNAVGYGSKTSDSNGNVKFYLKSGTYSISITHALYESWSESVTISQNTQLNRYLTPRFPDFSIAASPNTLTLTPNTQTTSTTTVASINNFNSEVSLSVSGAPSGITATLDQVEVTPPPNGQASSTLTITAGPTITLGTHSLTVTGTSGSIAHSCTITLVLKDYTTITVACEPSSTTLGNPITISGSINPARPSVPVRLSYSRDSQAWHIIVTVTTDPAGGYSFIWMPSINGSISIKASWDGDQYYYGATSTPAQILITGNIAQPTGESNLLLTLYGQTFHRGEEVTLTVTVFNPSAVAGRTLTLQIVGAGDYYHFDSIQVSALSNSYTFTWSIPSNALTGTYVISASLTPPTLTGFDGRYINVI